MLIGALRDTATAPAPMPAKSLSTGYMIAALLIAASGYMFWKVTHK